MRRAASAIPGCDVGGLHGVRVIPVVSAVKLIETHASWLTELPPPEIFMALLDHQPALATLWDLGENVQTDDREPSFPGGPGLLDKASGMAIMWMLYRV